MHKRRKKTKMITSTVRTQGLVNYWLLRYSIQKSVPCLLMHWHIYSHPHLKDYPHKNLKYGIVLDNGAKGTVKSNRMLFTRELLFISYNPNDLLKIKRLKEAKNERLDSRLISFHSGFIAYTPLSASQHLSNIRLLYPLLLINIHFWPTRLVRKL